MKYFPLIWAGLARKPIRSWLTLLSVLVAFFLFGMLQGINAGYAAVVRAQRLDRLLTDPRVPGGAPMPVTAVAKIRKVPGVVRVCGRADLYGYYQDPKNGLVAVGADAAEWFAVRPEYQMPADQLAALKSTRAGIVVTPALRDQLKLKLGDPVPIRSSTSPRKDGNPVWTFTLVGIFDNMDQPGRIRLGLINYDYFDDARATDIGTVDRVIVRIADASRSAQTASAIDTLFANSAHETRTQNEKEQTESSIQQLGDIGFFTNAIVGAVLFALLFVTGNTMAQTVRERIPEFAVLKTIGFPGLSVVSIVLAESVLLCVTAAAAGLAVAAAVFPAIGDIIGFNHLSWIVVPMGLAMAALLAIVSAVLPAWRAHTMSIVDALADR